MKIEMLALGVAALIVSAAAATPRQDGADEVLVQIKAPLDEPRRLCFDLSGYGDHINWADAVQTHTCKEGYDHADQLVELAAAKGGRLKLPRYGRCLEARAGKVYGVACADAPSQAWTLAADGRLSPSGAPGQCATIGPASSPADHPPEVKPGWRLRPMTLEACAPALAARQQWALVHAKQRITH